MTIKGEKQEGRDKTTEDYYISERRYGSFRRAIWLPSEVDAAKAEANYSNGLLKVRLPKAADAKKRQTIIPICTK